MHAGTPAGENGAGSLSPPYLQFVDEHGDGIELFARAGRVGHRERGIRVSRRGDRGKRPRLSMSKILVVTVRRCLGLRVDRVWDEADVMQSTQRGLGWKAPRASVL